MNSLSSSGATGLPCGGEPVARHSPRPESWIAFALMAAALAAAWAWHEAGMELFLAGLGGFCL